MVHGTTWMPRTSLSGGAPNQQLILGAQGGIRFMGDWNGDGIDTVGFYRRGGWHLRAVGRAVGSQARQAPENR